MKLFIITDVLSVYAGHSFHTSSTGMVAIKAKSLEQAREFFMTDQTGHVRMHESVIEEFDDAIKNGRYTEFDLADTDDKESGVIVEVFGGG